MSGSLNSSLGFKIILSISLNHYFRSYLNCWSNSLNDYYGQTFLLLFHLKSIIKSIICNLNKRTKIF